jgi:hypothetical protein
MHGAVDNGDDVDDLLHDLILNEDVTLGLDDLHVQVVAFLLVDD